MPTTKSIGIAVSSSTAVEALDRIQRADTFGIPAAWMTTSAAGPDALTIFAAAAARTQRIMLGTSITPIWPKHPIAIAMQALVVHQISGGRFRLGLGPSHKPGITAAFGFDFKEPLTHLKEHIQIIKTLLHKGKVDFDGRYYHAHASIPTTAPVPIMASALRQKSYQLCGAHADAAISWVSPWTYLRDTALPALQAAAKAANRPTPPLIAHCPIAVHTNSAEVRQAVREQLGYFPRLPFYARMFADAGFPEALQSAAWSDAMIDSVVAHGSDSHVADKLKALLAYGMTEIIATPILVGPDKNAAWDKTARLLADVGKTLD
ncbi:MAG: LLM class flavin-dependent oxidoreductase [SAR202 cluster bacterium]|nr:LLM class flavin-dependent oxidoreductase [SAR202 cluster bacterium]